MDPEDRVDFPVFFWSTRKVPEHEKLRIEVNQVFDPYHMIFNIIDDSYNDQFAQMMLTLRHRYVPEIQYANSALAIPKSSLRIGLPCIVSHEKVCFRGVIISKTDTQVKVRTIDYGTDVVISRAEYSQKPVYWMHRDLLEIPIQGVSGKLKFLRPKGKRWTKEATNRLTVLLQDREVNAVIIKAGPPGEKVGLCLECPETGENIEVELVKAGLAEFITSPASDDEDEVVNASRSSVDVVVSPSNVTAPSDGPFLDRAIRAIDRSTISSTCSSDDDLEISNVRVYSSGASTPSLPGCNENYRQNPHDDSEVSFSQDDERRDSSAAVEDSGECPDVSFPDGLEERTSESLSSTNATIDQPAATLHDHVRPPRMEDEVATSEYRLESASEVMTSVSRSGRLSNVNVMAIKDPHEKEKLKEEIYEEMRSLQRRLAELDSQLDKGVESDSKEERQGRSKMTLNPDAETFTFPVRHSDVTPAVEVPSATVQPSALRPDAQEFTPKSVCLSEIKDSIKEVFELKSGDGVHNAKEASGATDPSLSTRSLRADAQAFTPHTFRHIAIVPNAKDIQLVHGNNLSPNAPVFHPQTAVRFEAQPLNPTAQVFAPQTALPKIPPLSIQEIDPPTSSSPLRPDAEAFTPRPLVDTSRAKGGTPARVYEVTGAPLQHTPVTFPLKANHSHERAPNHSGLGAVLSCPPHSQLSNDVFATPAIVRPPTYDLHCPGADVAHGSTLPYLMPTHPSQYPGGSSILNYAEARGASAGSVPVYITRKETWIVSDTPPSPTVRPSLTYPAQPPHNPAASSTGYQLRPPPCVGCNKVFYYPLGSH